MILQHTDSDTESSPQAENNIVRRTTGPQGFPDDGFNLRFADFGSMAEALDYAAQAGTGLNFYNSRGQLEHALSYADIRYRAIELGKRLLGLGLNRGERVGIIAEMHPDFVCMFFACQYAGLMAVPLPVVTGLGGRQGYEKQLARVLETSGTRIAIGPESLLPFLNKAAEGLELETVTTASKIADMAPLQKDMQPLGEEDPSHIQYSSGSTRYPLGIEISQRALMANARSVARDGLAFTKKERIASWLPFYHDMGLVGCLIIPITCQFTIDYIHTDGFARRPLQWLKTISENRCTISFSPTFGYDLCTRRVAGKDNLDLDLDLSCWRVAGIGGDMIRPDIFEKFADTFKEYGFAPGALTPSYGLAEATLAFSFAPPKKGVTSDAVDRISLVVNNKANPAPRSAGSAANEASWDIGNIASCGMPMPGYDLEIRNKNGQPVPDRHVGSVFIKGPSLMTGYYRDESATSKSIDDDGWLNTGDMGYTVGDEIFITGRQKDLIIINGRNIWPQDLEWHAETNVDAIRSRDTAAFSIEENGKEVPVILIQCRETRPEKRKELASQVHTVIYRNCGIDCRVELIPQRSLPFTTSGKLSRAKAKKAYLQGTYEVLSQNAA